MDVGRSSILVASTQLKLLSTQGWLQTKGNACMAYTLKLCLTFHMYTYIPIPWNIKRKFIIFMSPEIILMN